MEGDPGKDSWKSRKEWWMGVEREEKMWKKEKGSIMYAKDGDVCHQSNR